MNRIRRPVTLTIDPTVLERAKAYAKRQGLTFSMLVEELLRPVLGLERSKHREAIEESAAQLKRRVASRRKESPRPKKASEE
ncbi:MAG: hypothetical protein HYR85_05785 [Planctomycetes bacterium]|nr:hypothetical protein [Planctomycetota bacterium]MBI3843639.1 hypothetical protein [Planctomycetota bacterium]